MPRPATSIITTTSAFAGLPCRLHRPSRASSSGWPLESRFRPVFVPSLNKTGQRLQYVSSVDSGQHSQAACVTYVTDSGRGGHGNADRCLRSVAHGVTWTGDGWTEDIGQLVEGPDKRGRSRRRSPASHDSTADRVKNL